MFGLDFNPFVLDIYTYFFAYYLRANNNRSAMRRVFYGIVK